jgi:hypothetical protein
MRAVVLTLLILSGCAAAPRERPAVRKHNISFSIEVRRPGARVPEIIHLERKTVFVKRKDNEDEAVGEDR